VTAVDLALSLGFKKPVVHRSNKKMLLRRQRESELGGSLRNEDKKEGKSGNGGAIPRTPIQEGGEGKKGPDSEEGECLPQKGKRKRDQEGIQS